MRLLNVSKRPVSLVAFCAAVALSLSACVGEAEKAPMSESQLGWDSGQSQVESPDDVVAMSGEYRVTREGKLLRYASLPPAKKPELNEVAQVHDNNGAEAFASYFIRVMEYTWNSGDSSLLREISLPSCTWCEHMASTTDEDTANKGWIEGLRAHIKEVEPSFEIPEHPGLWHIVVHVETSEHKYYDGTRLHKMPGENARFQIQLRFDDGIWRVSEALGEEKQK